MSAINQRSAHTVHSACTPCRTDGHLSSSPHFRKQHRHRPSGGDGVPAKFVITRHADFLHFLLWKICSTLYSSASHQHRDDSAVCTLCCTDCWVTEFSYFKKCFEGTRLLRGPGRLQCTAVLTGRDGRSWAQDFTLERALKMCTGSESVKNTKYCIHRKKTHFSFHFRKRPATIHVKFWFHYCPVQEDAFLPPSHLLLRLHMQPPVHAARRVQQCALLRTSCLPMLTVSIYYMNGGRDSSVGIATRYGLDDPGIESRWR